MSVRQLIIASQNEGKIAEIKELLAPLGITVASSDDLHLPDVEETGKTFRENAILKARAIATYTDIPSLADDSGLCVDALNGRPGVYTARYGGYEKLLGEMKNIAPEERTARFECILALCIPNGPTNVFEGVSEGHISTQAKGEGGFGFDPVFIPNGDTRTYAEMSRDEKNQTSHRAKALAKLMDFLKNGPGDAA